MAPKKPISKKAPLQPIVESEPGKDHHKSYLPERSWVPDFSEFWLKMQKRIWNYETIDDAMTTVRLEEAFSQFQGWKHAPCSSLLLKP